MTASKLALLFILLFSFPAYSHTEDIYPDNYAIIKRMEYVDRLESTLKQSGFKGSYSLFGVELEHILILSKQCDSIKNYLLTGAHELGIISCTCRWYDKQIYIKIKK